MGRYIVNRLLIAIPVHFGITVINFSFLHIAPGDPIEMMIPRDMAERASGPEVSEEWKRNMRERLGLDKPVPVQYILWLREILQGNFGRSLPTQTPVIDDLKIRLWPTLKLTGTALILSLVLGISVGLISALKQYSWLDYFATILSFGAVSVPGFFMALAFIYIFSLKLGLLPTSGMSTLGAEASLWDSLRHLILPATVLGLHGTAGLIRYTRSSLLEVLRQDYVMTARAKGLAARVVLLRHAFRNALLPVITIVSLSLPGLFGGSVIMEQIFYWQGLGSMSVKAAIGKDYPTIMAFNLISACLVLLANLIADIAYAFADPRIRYGSAAD